MISSQAKYNHIFRKAVHMCLWKEPPQVSERFVFPKFDWEYHILLKIKTEEWDLKLLLFNYWNNLFLGSVKTYFLEVGAYVSVKRGSTSVSKGRFCLIWLEISHFLNIKGKEWNLKVLLFNYWNDFFWGLLERYFFEVGAYVSLKRGTASVW